jgi:hypothetical protein
MNSTPFRRAAKLVAPVILAVMLMGASAGKITVCHKGSDLSVSLMAFPGHLIHGDSFGSCTPPPPPECPGGPGDGSCWV